jgi:hypothetical protein
MTKVDWLAASGRRCIGHFSLPLAYSLQIPSTNGNKRDWQKKSSKQ